jgi:hypothetical protein
MLKPSVKLINAQFWDQKISRSIIDEHHGYDLPNVQSKQYKKNRMTETDAPFCLQDHQYNKDLKMQK